MTAFRLIPLPIHAALEMLLGLGLMLAPFVLGFAPAGLIASVAIGALVVGLALSSADDHGGLGVAAHAAFDNAAVIALIASAPLLAFAGDGAAAMTFIGAGLTQLALNSTTRYSRGR